MTIKRLIFVVILFTAAATMVWAACKSDCRDGYESAIKSCQIKYDSPDDADDLQRCIRAASDDYEACVEECDR